MKTKLFHYSLGLLILCGLCLNAWDIYESHRQRKEAERILERLEIEAQEQLQIQQKNQEEFKQMDYQGSVNSEIYHIRTCIHLRRVRDDNLLGWKTQEGAGKIRRPCKVCCKIKSADENQLELFDHPYE